jgi:hypothetical protein
MCAACGVIGDGPDWIDQGEGAGGASRVALRHQRLRLVDLFLRTRRIRLEDAGAAIVLRGPTGRSEVVANLAHVWAAVERLGLDPVDPLDDAFLASLGPAP